MEVTLSAGGTERITAKHILLAVGGRAVKAPIEGSVSRVGCKAHLEPPLEVLISIAAFAMLNTQHWRLNSP